MYGRIQYGRILYVFLAVSYGTVYGRILGEDTVRYGRNLKLRLRSIPSLCGSQQQDKSANSDQNWELLANDDIHPGVPFTYISENINKKCFQTEPDLLT